MILAIELHVLADSKTLLTIPMEASACFNYYWKFIKHLITNI